jgi:hypothetical protein
MWQGREKKISKKNETKERKKERKKRELIKTER